MRYFVAFLMVVLVMVTGVLAASLFNLKPESGRDYVVQTNNDITVTFNKNVHVFVESENLFQIYKGEDKRTSQPSTQPLEWKHKEYYVYEGDLDAGSWNSTESTTWRVVNTEGVETTFSRSLITTILMVLVITMVLLVMTQFMAYYMNN